MTLPIQVELVGAQMDVAKILLLIFSEHSIETRNARIIEQGKSSIEKVSVCSGG